MTLGTVVDMLTTVRSAHSSAAAALSIQEGGTPHLQATRYPLSATTAAPNPNVMMRCHSPLVIDPSMNHLASSLAVSGGWYPK